MWSPITDDPRTHSVGFNARLLSEEGMKALEAAKSAYDHGCGAWPTALVADRIVARRNHGIDGPKAR